MPRSLRSTVPLVAALLTAGVLESQGPPPRFPAGGTRVAVFDSRIVLDSMPERAAVESEFALEQAKARTLLAQASDSLRQALEQLTRLDARLSPREREASSLHLRAQELMVEEMAANLERVVLQRLDELRAPLLSRLQAAVRTVRQRERLQVVIDLAGSNGAVDADPSVDITATIIAELRKPRTDRRGGRDAGDGAALPPLAPAPKSR